MMCTGKSWCMRPKPRQDFITFLVMTQQASLSTNPQCFGQHWGHLAIKECNVKAVLNVINKPYQLCGFESWQESASAGESRPMKVDWMLIKNTINGLAASTKDQQILMIKTRNTTHLQSHLNHKLNQRKSTSSSRWKACSDSDIMPRLKKPITRNSIRPMTLLNQPWITDKNHSATFDAYTKRKRYARHPKKKLSIYTGKTALVEKACSIKQEMLPRHPEKPSAKGHSRQARTRSPSRNWSTASTPDLGRWPTWADERSVKMITQSSRSYCCPRYASKVPKRAAQFMHARRLKRSKS